MMKKTDRFNAVQDADILGRLLRSLEIRTVNRFDSFDVVNLKNGHRYKVEIKGQDINCTCKDSKNGNNCKHEIAVARDMLLFENF